MLKPFLITDAPLNGTNLIESSAGTGKTYTIAGLFLRLIIQKGLHPDQILVVTFTRAATEELKERIRTKLLLAREGFENGVHSDPLIGALIESAENPLDCLRRIRDALIDFDRAAIFTIHGFCQRVLSENAFETQSLFDIELKTESLALEGEVGDDFWRRRFIDTPMEWAGFALEKRIGPHTFASLLAHIRSPDILIIPETKEPAFSHLTPHRRALENVRQMWAASRDPVAEILLRECFDGRVYGSIRRGKDPRRPTPRQRKVAGFVAAMNRYLASRIGFPPPPQLAYFTSSKLKSALVRRAKLPDHPLFDACERLARSAENLAGEFDRYLCYQKAAFLPYAAKELSRRKKRQQIQFFDDLLVSLREALAGGESGSRDALVQAVRRQYRVALVDEFQDTDSIQYEIFSRLFSGRDSALFMIGDPKQAIYGFRGADVFSYLKASRRSQRKYTLAENWRATPALIDAVNTLFSRVPQPFVFTGIPFAPVSPGLNRGVPENTGLSVGNALTLWDITAGDDQAVPAAEATDRVLNALAIEIERLIAREPQKAGPGEIAVLVRTNRQARQVKHRLASSRIPAVLFSAGSVFRSREAVSMERVLAAIATPGDMGRLKAALATELFAIGAEHLRPDGNCDQLAAWQARFRRYHELWKQSGFIRMFRRLAAAESLRSRILNLPDGERRLTNLLHLCELLQEESMKSHHGIAELYRWLCRQRERVDMPSEAHQLRLESDAEAVKILTVHKSKGLEFPVVFCPFLWNGLSKRSKPVVFHDPSSGGRLTLDFGSTDRSGHAALARSEELSENLRLLYVAVTRAKQRCYLAWGRIANAESSALSYLLHTPKELVSNLALSPGADGRGEDPGNLLKAHMKSLSARRFRRDLDRLQETSRGAVAVSPLPGNLKLKRLHPQTAAEAGGPLARRRFNGRIDRLWQVTSYSALAGTHAGGTNLTAGNEPFPGQGTRLDEPGRDRGGDIFSFPRGAAAGIFFHDLFENLDFGAHRQADRRGLIDRKLAQHGFSPDWGAIVASMVDSVLSAPLPSDGHRFSLEDIRSDRLVREMEFYFPLRRLSPRKLERIFREQGHGDIPPEVPSSRGRLTFAPTRGFMNGFIDLAFAHGKRYYLLDWKSNYLGADCQDYRGGCLDKAMADANYHLQYHLYTLALHRHLCTRLPGYRYDLHFGGVFYIFLRGIDPVAALGAGIFVDRPSEDLILSLDQSLIEDTMATERRAGSKEAR